MIEHKALVCRHRDSDPPNGLQTWVTFCGFAAATDVHSYIRERYPDAVVVDILTLAEYRLRLEKEQRR